MARHVHGRLVLRAIRLEGHDARYDLERAQHPELDGAAT
jgi:hypothetical protein